MTTQLTEREQIDRVKGLAVAFAARCGSTGWHLEIMSGTGPRRVVRITKRFTPGDRAAHVAASNEWCGIIQMACGVDGRYFEKRVEWDKPQPLERGMIVVEGEVSCHFVKALEEIQKKWQS